MMSDDVSVSKCLGLTVVAMPCVGHMTAKGKDEQEAARLLYVSATRAPQRLVIGAGGDAKFGGEVMKSAESDVMSKDLTPAWLV